MIAEISAVELRRIIADDGEVALLDVSEAGQFGLGHLLLAVNLPYSGLELEVERLVPRRSCHVVVMDQGDGVASRAARRLQALGYTRVSVLQVDATAWAAAGFQLFTGVNVMSKAFGEFVEHAFRTPSISPVELKTLFENGADVALLDCRTRVEYAKQHVPNAMSCPGGELVYRFQDLVPSPETLVVVSCAGRTRGIIGSQSLINAGFRNRIVALSGGTQGWCLAGFELEHGLRRQFGPVSSPSEAAARRGAERVARSVAINAIDVPTLECWLEDAARTTYVLDVRTQEEYLAGHLPGSMWAPGGQLVQATDEWIATRGARVVLVDDDGVRAVMTASWLLQMGYEVAVLEHGLVGLELVAGSEPLAQTIAGGEEIDAAYAVQMLRDGAIGVSLQPSAAYRAAHAPGALWANRSRLSRLPAEVLRGRTLILFSSDGRHAHLAALDFADCSGRAPLVVRGGMEAWVRAGFPTVASPPEPPDADRIDFLFWLHDRHAGNLDAMREYLAWETTLPELVANDGSANFCLAARNLMRKGDS